MKTAKQVHSKEFQHTKDSIEHEHKESIRLNKYMSDSGICSRRDADKFIQEGRVTIDGKIAEVGTKVFSNQIVCLDDKPIQSNQKPIYIILNKPCGIICTGDTEIEDNIITYMNYPERIFPVGRLDRESSGLIILTNDGNVVNKILRSNYEHEKEYLVEINRYVIPSFIEQLSKGVEIYNPVKNSYQTTKPCKVYQETPTSFRIILSEGLNRQIRRMCTALHCKVTSLQRIRIMNIHLDGLKAGEWRYLSSEEITTLNELLQKSTTI